MKLSWKKISSLLVLLILFIGVIVILTVDKPTNEITNKSPDFYVVKFHNTKKYGQKLYPYEVPVDHGLSLREALHLIGIYQGVENSEDKLNAPISKDGTINVAIS